MAKGLTEAQRTFLWAAMRGCEPWDCEVPPRDPELRAVVADGLVAQATALDEDGDEVWWWQTTAAGRAALSGPGGEGGER